MKHFGIIVVLVVSASIGAAQGEQTKPASKPAIDDAEGAVAAARDLISKEPRNHAGIRKALRTAEAKAKGSSARKAEIDALWTELFARENKEEHQQLLKALEDALRDPATKPERVAELLEQAGLPPPEPGDEKKDALATAWNTVLINRMEPLLESARATAAAGELRAALDGYDHVIDEFAKAFHRHFAGQPNRKLTELFKEAIEWSDVLVGKLETPEYESSIPQMDVLGADRAAAGWGKSAGVDLHLTEGSAEITGVEIEGKKITGVASFGRFPARPWRDLIIDMSFTVVSGRVQMFLRYWPDKRNYMLNFDQKSGYELNKLYQVTLRIRGSKIEMIQPDQNPQSDVLTANISRTGGIGFGLDEGSKVVISSLKLKVLR